MTLAARLIVLAAVVVALLATAGCATVQPWERGTLAKPVMAIEEVVADVVRLEKGHTEGLEPKITEALVKLMLSAKGGTAQTAR